MLGYFPNSYPDELLYSLCARYSDQMQYFKKYTALELLFGHRGPVSSIDLPNRLGYLTATLPFGYGYSVDDLINKHTLLPYYGAFLPSNKISTVRQDLEADNKPKAVSRAGLATTQIKPPEQLRYCPVCVEMDRSQFGECYWHRVHQLPGVEICPHHSVLLEQSNIAIRRKTHQYDFISAEKAAQVAYKVKELELPNAFQEDLLHLARESAWLLNHPYFACNMQTLHEQYLVAFIERELAPYQGTVVQASKLFRQFRQRFPHQLLKLLQCDFDEGNKNNWLYRLNSSSPVVHPLYHLLVIRFLGYTLSEFIDLPTVFHPFGQKPWPCLNPACKYYRQPKIENIEINFQGGTRQPTGKFACECGFIYFRTGPDQSPEDRFRRNVRVQAYGAVWEEELQCLLKTPNLSIEKIAERLEVSPSTVHNQAVKLGLVSSSLKPSVCREDLATSLKAENDQSTFHIKVEKYQAEWLAILETNKGLGRKEITEKYTRVYSWLRNNDPTWLRANMPPKNKGKLLALRSIGQNLMNNLPNELQNRQNA